MITTIALALALAVPANAPQPAPSAPVAQPADAAPQPQNHSGHSPTSTARLLDAVARAAQHRQPVDESDEPRRTK